MGVLQHLTTNSQTGKLSNSWVMTLAFGIIVAFWAQFGYAGNFGVFLGFYSTCAWLPVVLVLIFIDGEVGRLTKNDEGKTVVDINAPVTTANVGQFLSCVGKKADNNGGNGAAI